MRETNSEWRKQQRIRQKLIKDYTNGIWSKQPKTLAKAGAESGGGSDGGRSQYSAIIESIKR
jgi:hypothetical protein